MESLSLVRGWASTGMTLTRIFQCRDYYDSRRVAISFQLSASRKAGISSSSLHRVKSLLD
jgi:hypothetical protein